MNYGIVLFPSKSFQDLANGYRRRYDSHYANIAPHITVKERFSLEDKGELSKLVEACVSSLGKRLHYQLMFTKWIHSTHNQQRFFIRFEKMRN